MILQKLDLVKLKNARLTAGFLSGQSSVYVRVRAEEGFHGVRDFVLLLGH